MERSVRWLDRCIEFHEKTGRNNTQNLFAIVQGGLDLGLRSRCLEEMVKRRNRVAGYAVGGLSGGEAKGEITHRHRMIIECFAHVVLARRILEGVRRL